MTLQHTPGPWSAMRADSAIHTLHDATGSHFANLRGVRGIEEIDQGEADARLIAEAPAMLETLRDVLSCCDANMSPADAVENARAILARIDGKGA